MHSPTGRSPVIPHRCACFLTARYASEQLQGRLVVAAVNLGVRTVAGFGSEVLVLGLPDPSGETVLLTVEQEVPLGGRVY